MADDIAPQALTEIEKIPTNQGFSAPQRLNLPTRRARTYDVAPIVNMQFAIRSLVAGALTWGSMALVACGGTEEPAPSARGGTNGVIGGNAGAGGGQTTDPGSAAGETGDAPAGGEAGDQAGSSATGTCAGHGRRHGGRGRRTGGDRRRGGQAGETGLTGGTLAGAGGEAGDIGVSAGAMAGAGGEAGETAGATAGAGKATTRAWTRTLIIPRPCPRQNKPAAWPHGRAKPTGWAACGTPTATTLP